MKEVEEKIKRTNLETQKFPKVMGCSTFLLCLLRIPKVSVIHLLCSMLLHLDTHVRLCCERLAEHKCPEYMGAVVWRAIKECIYLLTKVKVIELTCERRDRTTQRNRYVNKES